MKSPLRSFIIFILSTFSLMTLKAQSVAHDPYNSYRFNRANWESRNGAVDKGPWYEWWYYKVVTPEGRSFYWVYGVINPADQGNSQAATRAFVEIGDFENKKIHKKIYPVRDFRAAYDKTELSIANTPFSAAANALQGEMISDGLPIKWNLSLEKIWGWNAMGWGLPFNGLLDIAWYPAQASAMMSGQIQIGEEIINLNQVKAYQDRNWGQDFPDWWYWIVANEFPQNPTAALACGGGMPKVLGIPVMPALTCGLTVNHQTYSFRSTDLNIYDYDLRFGNWDLSLENLSHKLVVKATAPEELFMDLIFTTPHNEEFHDFETLKGNVKVSLFERKGLDWSLLHELVTDRGGIEWGSRDPNPQNPRPNSVGTYSTQVLR